MYLYLGIGEVVVGELIVVVIGFQKIYGLHGLKHHIVEIRGGVTRRDEQRRRTNKQGKIGLLSLWAVGRLSFAIVKSTIYDIKVQLSNVSTGVIFCKFRQFRSNPTETNAHSLLPSQNPNVSQPWPN